MVEANTPEFRAWVRYFKKQGFKPHMLTMVERKTIDKIAVPAMIPEMFDPAYVDSGGADPPDFQDIDPTEKLRAMGKAWLDRSDPVSSALLGNVPPKSAVPSQIVDYREFIAHCNANNLKPRPTARWTNADTRSAAAAASVQNAPAQDERLPVA